MTRGCEVLTCGRGPASKSNCVCGMRLCDDHAATAAAHDCPRSREVLAIADDPAALKRWKAENAPEEELTTQVIRALNLLPGIKVWRAKRKQGPRSSDDQDSVPDVVGFATPDGRFIGVETKRVCPPNCAAVKCSCSRQRQWGAYLAAAGGVYVGDVRNVQQAIDGVRMGLARARAGHGEAA